MANDLPPSSPPPVQFRLGQMFLVICVVATLLGAWRIHPALAVVAVYLMAMLAASHSQNWPRWCFIAGTSALAVAFALADVWIVAIVLAVFALALIEGPIAGR